MNSSMLEIIDAIIETDDDEIKKIIKVGFYNYYGDVTLYIDDDDYTKIEDRYMVLNYKKAFEDKPNNKWFSALLYYNNIRYSSYLTWNKDGSLYDTNDIIVPYDVSEEELFQLMTLHDLSEINKLKLEKIKKLFDKLSILWR